MPSSTGGYADGDILAKMSTDLGEMLQVYETEVPEYHQPCILKKIADGPFDRYMGYKRMDTLKRWRQGNSQAYSTTTTWKKDFYPVRYGVGAPIDIEEIRKLTNRLGSPTDQVTKNLMNRIPVWEQEIFIEQLEASTTTWEDGLDGTSYDGLSHFNNTADRFGSASGNIIVPTADGTNPDDYKSQFYELCRYFSSFKDEKGHLFFNTQVKPSDLLIIASMEYQENLDTALRAAFFPKNAAVGSTENVFGTNKLEPPDVQYTPLLTGKDYYAVYKNKKGVRPFIWTYGEYKDGSDGNFGVFAEGGANPMKGSDAPVDNKASYNFRKTDEGSSETVRFGQKWYALYVALCGGSALPQTSIKVNIT